MHARTKDSNLWGAVSRENVYLHSSCALKVKSYVSSTYLCEMAFSQDKNIKTNYRHLTDCVRLGVSIYEHSY